MIRAIGGGVERIGGRLRRDMVARKAETADGFTVDDARTFDAESNIRDGMGTVRDYAHFFRNKDIDEAEASGKGLLSREKGKRGWAIGKFAEDNLYWLYRNGGISEERAAAVARGAPNDADVQNAALDSAKGMDATTLEIHTRRLKAFKDEGGGNATGEAVQGDLFGVDDTAMREMVALSKAAGELVKQNKQRILAVKGVIKRPEIAREMGVDINNPDAVRAAVAALEYENSRLMSPTPEPEIMDKIRRKAGLFDKAENSENIEQGAGVETQEDTGGLFDDGTAEMSFSRAIRRKEWKPTDAEIKEVERQIKEVKAKWTNPDGKRKKGYLCAPNGKESRLTEKQWLAVRTPFFKEWFGDWETLAIINEVENMPAEKLTLSNKEYSQEEAKKLFESFGTAVNERNGESVKFPNSSVGKIIRHKGFPVGAVIGKFKSLFESSILAMNEKEEIKKGHKQHPNYLGYEHYINKFEIGGKAYYIRFTVPIEKAFPKTIREGYVQRSVHSSRISEISIYDGSSQNENRNTTTGIMGASLIDDKLLHFLNSVKKKDVSQVVDENGEPLVVYHGTENGGFTVFDKDLIASEGGFFFNDRKAVADEYAATPDEYEPLGENKVYAVFLNIRNPYIKDFKGERYNEFWTEMDVVKEEGYDGFIAKNIVDNRFSDSENTIPSTDYIVLDSTQVKSATDNVGTYNKDNPDMRFSRGASGKASSGGNVGGGVSFGSMVEEYGKLRELREKTVGEKPLTFVRPVSAMRSALPKSVRFNKADNRLEGVPSIGDIRRYMERVFNVPISNGLRKEVRQRGALGVYYNRLEAIRTLRGHVNDLDTVAHELGHYLETLFFGGKLASDEVKNFALAKELEDYCIERFGEFSYKGRERIGEGWAQFISDVIKGDETVADRCPRAFAALNSALRESPRVNEAFGFICQMAELNANASPLQRVNANIRRRSDGVRKTAVDRLIESGRWFTRMWFDEYEGLERFQRDLERSGVSEEDGIRVIDLARNYAGGSVGQVNYSLTVNQIDLDGRVVGKSLRSILRDNLKTAYDKDNIDAYLMCRRVVEYYKTEERRVERAGSRGKFGIDYADAVDVVSTATDGMRKCAEELDVYYIFIAKFPADLLLIISVLPFSSAVAFLPRFTDFPPTDSVASSEK